MAAALVLAAAPGAAQQDVAVLSALGHAAWERREPLVALEHFRAVLARDSLDYVANWEGALALIDLGSDTPEEVESPARDSLYARAEAYAKRAVRAFPESADAWFVLANAMGRTSLTKGNRERVRHAAEIRDAARRAIALDPRHDGAYHVLGRWHAEIMRLSGIQKFFARTFLGGRILGQASWDSATANLERSVAIDPARIVHRIDLARVYVDLRRYADARVQLERIAGLPVGDYGDERRRDQAAALLVRIANRD